MPSCADWGLVGKAAEWMSLMQDAFSAGMYEAALTGGECLTYPEGKFGILKDKIEQYYIKNYHLTTQETK